MAKSKTRTRLRFRLLPVTIFAAVLLLGVRVGDLWGTLSRGEVLPEVSPLQAQTAEPAGPAMDADSGSPTGTSVDGADQPDSPDMAAPASDESGVPSVSMELIRSLTERREQLDERERQLDQREAMLVVAERRVEQKLIELEMVRGEIEDLLQTLDEQQTQQIMSLVKIYESMKPKDAALIFEELDRRVLLDVVERMKEAKVAPILAAMNPSKAQEVTAALAERRQLPETARP